MNKTQLSWLAGFLEGEGSFVLDNYTSSRRGRPRAVIQVTQVQKWPLEQIARIVGRGVVRGPYLNKGSKQGHFRWGDRGPVAEELMELLFPLMSPRRQEQIARVLDEARKPYESKQHDYPELLRKGWETRRIRYGPTGTRKSQSSPAHASEILTP